MKSNSSMIWIAGFLACATGQAADRDLAPYFLGLKGTFVLYDSAKRSYVRYNPARAGERLSPCSTYKIPNSLIGLETGVVRDAAFVIPYDAKRDPQQPGWNPEWPRDHDLRSAFRFSVVWYYQEVARRVGAERMKNFVHQFGYGNEDTSGGIDRFWLGRSLLISADEQVAFLQRFYEDRLGVSARTTGIVKDIMLADQGAGWKLSAKTGACRGDKAEAVVWYVGFVEKAGNVFYFALNLGGQDMDKLIPLRITKAREILEGLGVIEARK
jgi:beta-lactamase class D